MHGVTEQHARRGGGCTPGADGARVRHGAADGGAGADVLPDEIVVRLGHDRHDALGLAVQLGAHQQRAPQLRPHVIGGCLGGDVGEQHGSPSVR
eukprot:6412793-Prymnesium_polylepis.2